ncbi:MoaA/NifB/PqqE/SkfB family radical SAM enzyme [Paraburkholderia sp. BL23I1N1]|uniref:radical SAM protein n=1 Tax=Paraburkholderia sp. BL23I1N1 TaxID=1938802 RepID=UPI000E74061D|nr:radical SAM protein [Paraburkholderia sp. BL23I1N1]RKE37608.1 MoaA/NifB/PqqE/SkfB family radical SAM enzyme [Paraburkholderia sp. BL23I1N1]
MDSKEQGIVWRDRLHVDRNASEPQNPLPAVCDVSVTNLCNAACDFCGFSRDKHLAGPRRYLEPDEFARALPILRRRRIRYMTFQGGEPLVHPEIESLVALATQAGMHCGLITNGWFLPRHIEQLAAAGLKRLLISIDSADMSEHELNRGLHGLEARIVEGIARAHAFGIPVCASVTVSRLVRYDALPETLARLGFDAVTFSYPRREPFGSTSLVYDEKSALVDLSRDELLDALGEIANLKKRFRVMDPSAALTEVARFVRGEEQLIPCIGGSKYFYIDWNLDVWRCEAWSEPMGSVFDFDRIPDQREPCNACMMACYRHASVLMHGAIAATDSVYALGRGDFRVAVSSLFQRSVAYSLWALSIEELPRLALTSLAGRIGRRPSLRQDL